MLGMILDCSPRHSSIKEIKTPLPPVQIVTDLKRLTGTCASNTPQLTS